ncbi:MAG: polysaccharide ABC transporter ATP-binding protein [Pseudomonadota bacterium]
MSTPMISADKIGKKYLIGQRTGERSSTLRDVITRSAGRLARTSRDIVKGRALIMGDEVQEFWALKDVSFELNQGDTLAVIGRNGAGKSTLLKVLSRITEPSSGRAVLRGRVASLLEVGTGFHPELNGRENIFLNGAILGMTRQEIQSKFDEIVDFAGVEKFLETPVKRYSSGMYVRLAFAVAAHLEPEILIVDEVLAVGDAEFQRKCLGKMESVAGEGRTVIFVSHNLSSVRRLCEKGLVLSSGQVTYEGTVDSAIEYYAQFAMDGSKSDELGRFQSDEGFGSESFAVHEVKAYGTAKQKLGQVSTDEEMAIEVEFSQPETLQSIRMTVMLFNAEDVMLFATTDETARSKITETEAGRYRARCLLPSKILNRGEYRIEIQAAIPRTEVLLKRTHFCSVRVDGLLLSGTLADQDWPGAISPEMDWSITPIGQ